MKRLQLTPRMWLIIRFLIFPALIVASFFGVRWSAAACWSPSANSYGLSITNGPGAYSALFWVGIVLFFGVLFMSLNNVSGYRTRKNFLRNQLILALSSIAITIPLYLWLHAHGQASFSPNWWCDSEGHLHGMQAPHTILGIGISPSTVVFFAVLYVLAPVMQFYADKTGRRVGGIKKHDLFQ